MSLFFSPRRCCVPGFLCKNFVKYSGRLGWRAALALLVHSKCRVIEARKGVSFPDTLVKEMKISMGLESLYPGIVCFVFK